RDRELLRCQLAHHAGHATTGTGERDLEHADALAGDEGARVRRGRELEAPGRHRAEAVQGAQRHGRIGVVGRIRHRRIERQVRRALQQQVGGEGDDTAGGIEAGGDDAGHRTAVIVVDRWYVYRAWAVAAAAAGGQCDREQTDGEGLQDSHVETPWCDVLV